MTEQHKMYIVKTIIGVGVLLGIFLITESLYTYKQMRDLQGVNTITVNGTGKVEKAPDTARVSFTIEDTQKTLAPAQDIVSKKIDAVTTSLSTIGIEKKDITTDSYSSYPEYTYPQAVCTISGCTNPSPILKGYHVAHAVTIKVKDLTKTDDVLTALGKIGVTNMSGPNFGFDDDKAIAREARDLAITDAQTEASKLAKSLGVHLVRVVSFNEGGSNVPSPMYNTMAASAAPMAKSDTVSIPTGSQKVETNISITYEIR
ncbi:MAG: SIMPL domain-containing protein [bacterium]